MKSTDTRLTADQRACVRLVKRALKGGETLESLATHLGTSFSTVSRWRAEINTPSNNTARRMVPMLEALLT